MTVYEKFYKNDDSFMMKALSYYLLSDDTDCDDCPVSELCKENNDLSCRKLFLMWLQKEVEDAKVL